MRANRSNLHGGGGGGGGGGVLRQGLLEGLMDAGREARKVADHAGKAPKR